MHAVIECWVRVELAWAAGQLTAAAHLAQDMIVFSEHADWEQMAYVSHLLLAQLHELQGRPRDALAEHRALRRREQRVRAERMESRYHVVQAQLDVLDTRRNLAHMARYSQELERLSYEDALTGLANRRLFDMRLAELLADGFEEHAPHCVAVVDLDRFKQINDRHSHLVGDEVLRAVARVLHAAVRQSDLAARYAGDEFVVLFPRTPLPQAQQVCERIRRSVDELVVHAATGPVRVAVSIGIAQADRGEGPAEVLHRADVAMYAQK
jgi:diguanylate cyclase (GGDEF)-like protein